MGVKITGTLAGMQFKMEGIPPEWLNSIAGMKDVDQLINEFSVYCADKAVLKEMAVYKWYL